LWLSLLSTIIGVVVSGLVLAAKAQWRGTHFEPDAHWWDVVLLFGYFGGILMAAGWILAIPAVVLLSPPWIARHRLIALVLGTGFGPVTMLLAVLYLDRHSHASIFTSLQTTARSLYMAIPAACITSAIYVTLVCRQVGRQADLSREDLHAGAPGVS
jgi:hypothetical protein